jgi:hypothetical protein
MNARVLALALILLCGAAFAQTPGPYGVFGGPIPSTKLPSGAPVGTIAFTSDQGQMVSNGSTWVVVSSSTASIASGTILGNSSGSTAAPSALTALPSGVSLNCNNNTITGMQSLCHFVDVMAFGAVCNDVNDDTAAIQNAINSVSNYATVLFPDFKTCKTTSTIEIPLTGLFLEGSNKDSTFIDFEPAATFASVSITGTAGQFSCACSGLAVGEIITISGTYGGTGSITGYTNPTSYYVSAVTGTYPNITAFTLKTLYTLTSAPAAIVTTAGTPTGLTFTLASASAFRFGVGGGVVKDQDGIEGLTIYSNNTTVTKTGIETVDVSVMDIVNVTVGNGGASGWSGSSTAVSPDTQAGSIGLRIRGRDNFFVNRFYTNFVDRPIVLSANPDSFNDAEDCNQCQFGNILLEASGNNEGPLVWVDDGVAPSNNSWDGVQSWVGGTYGYYYNNTQGTVAAYNNAFQNVQWEQPSGTTGYAFYINDTTGQYNEFSVSNAFLGTSNNGVYLNGCHYCDFKNVNHSYSSGTFFNLQAGNFHTTWEHANVAAATTLTTTGQQLMYAEYNSFNLTIPTTAVWEANNVFTDNQVIGSVLAQNAIDFSGGASFLLNGYYFSQVGHIIRDTTGTGTIAEEAINAFGANTLAATNASVTVTNEDNLYVAAPLQGSNVTATNKWSVATGGGIKSAGPIVSAGTHVTVASGTGTCATAGTPVGGVQAGDFTCTTAGTAASTVTLTLPATLTAYSCWGRDITTPTTVTQTGAKSTTSVTLTLTSVTASDDIQFGCLGY